MIIRRRRIRIELGSTTLTTHRPGAPSLRPDVECPLPQPVPASPAQLLPPRPPPAATRPQAPRAYLARLKARLPSYLRILIPVLLLATAATIGAPYLADVPGA